MQKALKKRRGPPTTPRKPKHVGGLLKFLPPSYTDRVSTSKHIPNGVVGHITNQPVAILSDKVDESGCVQVARLVSINKTQLKLLSDLDRALMARFIPIELSEVHPATGDVILRLAPGTKKRLPSNTYIDIGETNLVSFRDLRDYNGARSGREKLSLTAESYVQLAELRASWDAARSMWRLCFLCVAVLLVIFGTTLLLFGAYLLGASN